MLDSNEIADLIAQVSYKPGYHVDWDPRGRRIRSRATVPARSGSSLAGAPITVQLDWEPIPRNASLGHLKGLIFRVLKVLEIHEAMECFMIDGHRFFDPHDPVVRAAIGTGPVIDLLAELECLAAAKIEASTSLSNELDDQGK